MAFANQFMPTRQQGKKWSGTGMVYPLAMIKFHMCTLYYMLSLYGVVLIWCCTVVCMCVVLYYVVV